MRSSVSWLLPVLVCACSTLSARPPDDPPVPNPVAAMLERYDADRDALLRCHDVPMSPARRERLRRFTADTLKDVEAVDFESLGVEGRIDHLLFREHLRHELAELAREEKLDREIAPLLPFAPAIVELEERRRRFEAVEPSKVAATLAELAKQAKAARKALEGKEERTDRVLARRAGSRAEALRRELGEGHRFYTGYHPEYSWWASKPYEEVDRELKDYATFLSEKIAGTKKEAPEGLVGDPIGRETLLAELAFERIPYSPEELVALAEREFAWCEERYKEAARAMGLGDDWKKALEKVKSLHVPPGKQPELIRDLAREAEAFLEKHDLVTMPPLAREVWRMEMMPPERQKTTPYFTGGEVISVSYPTLDMAHDLKLMVMRGNNVHFARATVHHELIPGHHLQGFMAARHRTHRRVFRTAFLVEGWALYWEMLLWDLDFPRSPEDRVGMLFWRMHRCARIIVSLKFHLGQMKPAEMVAFLTDRVGHEPAGAEAEVRRYIAGGYGPLYQAAYMLGGLQLRALHKELVASGKMTNRAFHDAVLRENMIPIEMIRAGVSGTKLPRDHAPSWRFLD